MCVCVYECIYMLYINIYTYPLFLFVLGARGPPLSTLRTRRGAFRLSRLHGSFE